MRTAYRMHEQRIGKGFGVSYQVNYTKTLSDTFPKVPLEVVRDPAVKPLESLICFLQSECGAELRLPPLVGLHHRQCQIDAGRDARRGPDRSVTNKDRIGIKVNRGKACGELSASPPRRHGTTTIEKPGFGQQKGTTADGRSSCRRGGPSPDPVEKGGIAAGGIDAEAAGDNQGSGTACRRRQCL